MTTKTLTQAQRALQDLQNAELRDSIAVRVQFFSRCSVYEFADGSRLTFNFYSPSYAD